MMFQKMVVRLALNGILVSQDVVNAATNLTMDEFIQKWPYAARYISQQYLLIKSELAQSDTTHWHFYP